MPVEIETVPCVLGHAPQQSLSLEEGEVHVWRVRLNQAGKAAGRLRNVLSADERKRAAGFYFKRDQEHFIVSRAFLRAIVGRYLKRESWEVRFSHGAYGKPMLAPDSPGPLLCFNLSHSHEVVLYALTWGRDVGIDVELIRPDTRVERIAAQCFSTTERRALGSLPPEQQPVAFFKGWVRKEAFVKAVGVGLSFPLDQFDVSLTPDEPARILRVRGSREEALRWTLEELQVGSGYAAAIAIRGGDVRLKLYESSCACP